MATANEVLEFLDIVSGKGFLNANTASARKTACKKFFDILDENERTVEYLRDNIAIIKARFSNLNKGVAGKTVDEYGRRVQIVLKDFTEWREDRGGWERRVSTKKHTRTTTGSGKKKQKATKKKRTSHQAERESSTESRLGEQEQQRSDVRTVKFPIRDDFELEIKLPQDGLSVAELRKVAYFLLPYTHDWEPTESPGQEFQMLKGG